MPTEQDKFKDIIDKAMIANPEFIMFINPNELIKLAAVSIKKAELLFRMGQLNMIEYKKHFNDRTR